jgi:uncharacterized membrane protein
MMARFYGIQRALLVILDWLIRLPNPSTRYFISLAGY